MRACNASRTRVISSRRSIGRSEEHTSELQSRVELVCRLLLEKKNHRYGLASVHRTRSNGHRTTNPTSQEAYLGQVMRPTLSASLTIRHTLASSTAAMPAQMRL